MNGKSLERAIELIENQLLSKISKEEIGRVTIIPNKQFTKNGVRHEIDLYVLVDLKIGTKLIYIYECKNWGKKKVSKNDIIIFEEKINVVGAQCGYFIAKQYSRDARNRAKQSKRIELLNLEVNDFFGTSDFITIQSKCIKSYNFHLDFVSTVPITGNKEEVFNGQLVLSNNEISSLNSQVRERIASLKYKQFPDTKVVIDKDDYLVFEFTILNAILKDTPVEEIKVTAQIEFEFFEPELVYEYRVEGKGRYNMIKLKDIWGNPYTMELTSVGSNIQIAGMDWQQENTQ